MSVYNLLRQAYNEELAQALLGAYEEIGNNYSLGKWKASELNAGHFVEAARRILEQQLFGSYTPFDDALEAFYHPVLIKYKKASGQHESFRILIPRALRSIYTFRNRRGVAHISGVSPNEMDSTYILYTVKWVLAEFVRLNSNYSTEDTQKLINTIIERKNSLIWKTDSLERVLDKNLPIPSQILVLLYVESPRTEDELRSIIEFWNRSKFKDILKNLHRERKIELTSDGTCTISPIGMNIAEDIIISAQFR